MKRIIFLLALPFIMASCHKHEVNYTEYVCTITQSSESDPVVTVLSNDIGDITWNRTGEGTYAGILNGAFSDAEKVSIVIGENIINTEILAAVANDNTILLVTKDINSSGLTFTDGRLFNTSLEIKIFD